ncbi:MAG: FkbM family methyltransferase [Chthoniobacterales bacterium]|nr:FkbM family methyltransferase [Chthoniobacterales bacterium]
MIVDAGAHRGEFSAILKKELGCRCVLIEANPDLAGALEDSGFDLVISAALAARDGRANLQLRDNLESSSIASQEAAALGTVEVETVSLETILKRAGSDCIDLLKLDVEGAEFELIENTPADCWRKVRQITVEFHDFEPEWSGDNLFQKARSTLVDLGFVPAVMSFRTHGDVLFLNRTNYPLGRLQSFYFKHGARIFARAFLNC